MTEIVCVFLKFFFITIVNSLERKRCYSILRSHTHTHTHTHTCSHTHTHAHTHTHMLTHTHHTCAHAHAHHTCAHARAHTHTQLISTNIYYIVHIDSTCMCNVLCGCLPLTVLSSSAACPPRLFWAAAVFHCSTSSPCPCNLRPLCCREAYWSVSPTDNHHDITAYVCVLYT